MNEPARASEPLGVHWGNFAESRVLKQTWLRDGPDGPDGRDRKPPLVSLWGKGVRVNGTHYECHNLACTVRIESKAGPATCTRSIRVRCQLCFVIMTKIIILCSPGEVCRKFFVEIH